MPRINAIPKRWVFSLGGSLIVPDEKVDEDYLASLRDLVLDLIISEQKFFIITGGGAVCRMYQAALKNLLPTVSSEIVDLLGIEVTDVNAHLVRGIFADKAFPQIIRSYELLPSEEDNYAVIVGGGWQTGHSSDLDALFAAKLSNVEVVVNLTNQSHVFTADPQKNTNAKPLDYLTWQELQKIVGNTWRPGLNRPFDPIAAKFGAENGLTVVTVDGRNIANLHNLLMGNEFVGTIVKG